MFHVLHATKLGKSCDIAEELMFPLPAPVVSCQSHFSSYFHAFPGLNVLRVPLKEGHFLLHLPDLYHELGHSQAPLASVLCPLSSIPFSRRSVVP
jgi:hypothetical protein